MKSTIFTFLLLTLIAKPSHCTPPDKDDVNLTGIAIQRAVEQQALLIQLAQIYTLQLLETANKKSYQNEVAACSKKFEQNYAFIKSLQLIKTPYTQIELATEGWTKFKRFFEELPKANNLPTLLIGIDSLSKSCELVANELVQSSLFHTLTDAPFLKYHQLGHLVKKTAHQKIYCERIILYYLIARVQSDVASYNGLIQKNAINYQQNIQLIKQAKINPPPIDYKIYQLEYEWERLQVLCDNIEQLPKIKQTEVFAIRDYLSDITTQIEQDYIQLMDEKIASAMLLEMLPVASQQRLFTQTITRAYLGITTEIEVDNHQKLLKSSILQFDENLTKLRSYAPNLKIKKAIDEVAFLWKNYTVELNKTENTKSNASKLLQYNSELLRVCNNLVILLKLYAKSIPDNGNFNKSNIDLMDKNAKQAVLAERLMLYYMANEWMPENKLFLKLLNKTIGQYNRGLQEIKRSLDGTRTEIQQTFTTVWSNWKIGQKIFQRHNSISEAFVMSKLLATDMLLAAEQTRLFIASPTKNQAINIATRQSMLTQKITSHVLLYSIDKKNQLALEQDLSLFDEQLIALKKYATTTKSIAALNKLQIAWKTYKKSVQDKSIFEKDNKILIANSNKLLSLTDLLSTRIFTDNRKVDLKTTTAISLAGQQRTVLQKIILYTILDTKNSTPKTKKQLQNSWNTYKFVHRNLAKLSIKSPVVEKHLQQIMLTAQNLENRWLQNEKITTKQLIWYQRLLLTETESLVMAYQNINVTE